MTMREGENQPVAEKGGVKQAILNVFGVILCVLFIPIIILNVVMIVRSYTNTDSIPSVFGYSPVIVLSGSMSPEFEAGDMILIKKAEPETLQVGDVICFLEEETAVTHRIIAIENEDGADYYITQGDANNTEDASPVTPQQVQGKYTGVYFTGLGDFAIFLQSTPGMLIFIGGPIALFVLWDLIRKTIFGKKAKKENEGKQQELAAMEQELARLRAQVGETTDDTAEN